MVLVPGGHGIGRSLQTHIRSSGTDGACGSRVAARGGSRSGSILDLGGQRLRPPMPVVGTRGVDFRPGRPVRGLAGVQWDTARSGLDGRRNPGRTVRRQTGLRADGGFAQGRRAQDWAGSLEDREDPGLRDNFRSSEACEGPWDQHGSSTRCSRVAAVRTRAKKAPPAYSPPVHLRHISALTCQYSFCRRDVALRSTIRGGSLGRATHGPDVRRRFHPGPAVVGPTRRHHGADRP